MIHRVHGVQGLISAPEAEHIIESLQAFTIDQVCMYAKVTTAVSKTHMLAVTAYFCRSAVQHGDLSTAILHS